MSLMDINQVAGRAEIKSAAERETKNIRIAGSGGDKPPTRRRKKVAASAASGGENLEPIPAPAAGEPPDGEDGQSLAELRKRETIILQGRDVWRDGSTALLEIRERKLYRAIGFTDFGLYCKKALNMGKSTINRHIAIGEVYAEVCKAVASTEAKVFPTSERQMRPLLSLRSKDQQPLDWGKTVAEVWTKAVQDSEILKEPLTQKVVLRALQQLHPAPKRNESQPESDLEKRWRHLEALLEHEREFWPGNHRRELQVRIVGLISTWDDGQRRRLELEEVTVERVQGGEHVTVAEADKRS